MLQQERHDAIISKLNKEGSVRVREIAKEFDVTEDCIRKDLTILETKGLLKRIHGGAQSLRTVFTLISANERKDQYIDEKREIAAKAVELINEGDMIFLDVSTNTLEIAKEIYVKNLKVTVVTNMIDILQIFASNCNIEVIFIGGRLNPAKDGFIGPTTIEMIKQYKYDKAFVGTVGIDLDRNLLMTYNEDDQITKQYILNASKKGYIVTESAKFNQDGKYVFSTLGDIDALITSNNINVQILTKIQQYELEVI